MTIGKIGQIFLRILVQNYKLRNRMAAPEKDIVEKFKDMALDFKSKNETVMDEVLKAFGTNLNAAVKNYTDLQSNYTKAYNGLTSETKKANKELLADMDKQYAEFTKQLKGIYTEMSSKTEGAVTSGASDFQKQCADVIKKFPMLPENIYKDVLSSVSGTKDRLSSEMEKRYKEVLDKIEKNFQALKKELTVPEMKTPTIPPLEIDPNLLSTAKDALASAVANVKNLAGQYQQASSSKK